MAPSAWTAKNQLMVDAQREAFADAMADYDPTFWASKLHFYITGQPFYDFPYTFGFLFSAGIYGRAKEDGAALPRSTRNAPGYRPHDRGGFGRPPSRGGFPAPGLLAERGGPGSLRCGSVSAPVGKGVTVPNPVRRGPAEWIKTGSAFTPGDMSPAWNPGTKRFRLPASAGFFYATGNSLHRVPGGERRGIRLPSGDRHREAKGLAGHFLESFMDRFDSRGDQGTVRRVKVRQGQSHVLRQLKEILSFSRTLTSFETSINLCYSE